MSVQSKTDRVRVVPGISVASQRFVPWQISIIVAGLLMVGWVLFPEPDPLRSLLRLFLGSGWLLYYLLTIVYGVWTLLQSLNVLRSGRAYIPSAPVLTDEELPSYTILLPLYREAPVVPQLIRAISDLDYPPELLEVFCLLRPDDTETREAIIDCRGQSAVDFKILLLPPELPVGTKPAACNWGLAHASGELLVIYDAEDIPDRDQLRKAAVALRHAPRKVACVQAPKRPYNGRTNLLTRLYEMEMLTWQLLQLPGVTSWEKCAPLYGSGAHFRTEVLRELGGWDFYNVTEDCDLGIRLHRNNYFVALIDSVTGEEAPPTIGDWLRQRTRWNKGFLQTFLTHTRNPFTLIGSLGLLRAMGFSIRTGAAVINQLLGFTTRLAPLIWLVIVFARRGNIDDIKSSIIESVIVFFGMALLSISIAIQASGPALLRRWRLMPFALLMPFYWTLLGVTAWRAVWQLTVSPFKWEKTPHGK